MEENKVNEITNDDKVKAIVVVGSFLIGYIIGKGRTNKSTTHAYREGVSDTLSSLVFKNK